MNQPNCTFCEREISEAALEWEGEFKLSLYRLIRPGRGRREVRTTACTDCREEIRELLLDVEEADVEPTAKLQDAPEICWQVETCGFCGDRLSQDRMAMTYFATPRDLERRSGDPFAADCFLCLSCGEIIESFLENIPERTRDGEIYLPDGDAVGTAVEDANFEAIYEDFLEVSVGDYIRFEAHNPATEQWPDEYVTGAGEVTDFTEGWSEVKAVIESDSNAEVSSYKIWYRFGREVRKLTAETIFTDGGTTGHGFVTVLETERPIKSEED